MNLSKSLLFASVLFFSGNTFSGTEDWTGTFHLARKNGLTNTVIHTPIDIKYGYIHAMTYHFSKGICIQDFCAIDSGVLEPNMSVETFTEQLKKLGGKIVGTTEIKLGSSYQSLTSK